MRVHTKLVAALPLLLSAPAMAASDITVDVTAPSNVLVYSPTAFSVVVRNTGNANASNVAVSIQLPATHTSPQVYVMGTLSGVDSRCVRSGTVLNCSLGTLKKFKYTTVAFNLALPESAAPLVVSAHGSTSSAENSYSNNDDSLTASQTFYATSVADGDLADNRHCTGTGLTAFFECELFPSSISSHVVEFGANGVVTVPGYAGYVGIWYQTDPDHLYYNISYGTSLEMEFEGYGVGGDCFEGLTTFPGSTYVSPYEVCLQ